MLKIGTVIIHPSYGICKIAGIINRDPKSENKTISYVLRPNKNIPGDFKIYVDEDKIVESGARTPVSEEKIDDIYKVLSKRPDDLSEDSRHGYPGTEEKLKSGDFFSVGEVIRDLEWQDDGLFSSKRKNLLESANNILLEEISYVKQVKKSEAKKSVMKALRKI